MYISKVEIILGVEAYPYVSVQLMVYNMHTHGRMYLFKIDCIVVITVVIQTMIIFVLYKLVCYIYSVSIGLEGNRCYCSSTKVLVM